MLSKILVFLVLACQPILGLAANAMPGGYNPVDLKDKELAEVVNFAVKQMQQGTLVKVVSALKQVVSGLNYSIQLEMLGANGVHNLYNVIVYVPLPQTKQPMQLTNMQFIGEVPAVSVDTQVQTNLKQ